MKINGYRLRAAIKRKEVTLQVAIRTFEESAYQYASDKQKYDLGDLMETVANTEIEITDLQACQSRYNLSVLVPYTNTNDELFHITLCQAVKLVGGAGREEKLWRSLLPKKERYGFERVPTRSAGDEHAKLAVNYEELVDYVDSAAKCAANLRANIAVGNNTEVEIPELSEDMLD